MNGLQAKKEEDQTKVFKTVSGQDTTKFSLIQGHKKETEKEKVFRCTFLVGLVILVKSVRAYPVTILKVLNMGVQKSYCKIHRQVYRIPDHRGLPITDIRKTPNMYLHVWTPYCAGCAMPRITLFALDSIVKGKTTTMHKIKKFSKSFFFTYWKHQIKTAL